MTLTIHSLSLPQGVQCHSFEGTEERVSGTTTREAESMCLRKREGVDHQVDSLKLPLLLSLRLGRGGG